MNHAEIATAFLRMCARGDVREAYERYVAADFVHHNAWFPGDRESLLLAMEQSAAAEPNKSFEPKQVVDGGDRVALLSHLQRAVAGAGDPLPAGGRGGVAPLIPAGRGTVGRKLRG